MSFNQSAYDLGQQDGRQRKFEEVYANGVNSNSYINGWVQGTTEREDWELLEVEPVVMGDQAFECKICGAVLMSFGVHRNWHLEQRFA